MRAEISSFVNAIGPATDTVIVAAVPGNRIRIVGGYVSAGTTASATVQFNSKGAGAGTACAGLINLPINGSLALGDSGEFETNVGEGLTVTTVGAGPTAVDVTYILEPDNTPGQAGSVGGSGFPRS